MPVLILACNRREELEAALYALSRVERAHLCNITISVDCAGSSLDGVADAYSSTFLAIQVVDSYQRSAPPDAWTDERVSRHWVSALSRLFADGHRRVLYLEEDHVVMPDIVTAERKFDGSCGEDCFAMNLACHAPCSGKYTHDAAVVGWSEPGNIAVVYYREKWALLLEHIDTFCSYRGDWDHNLRKIGALGIVPWKNVQLYKPRAYHLHDCVSARTSKRHFDGKYCGKRRQLYDAFLSDWHQGGASLLRPKWVDSYTKPAYGVLTPAPSEMKRMCLRAYESAMEAHTAQ
jgi:hypothetical protein